MSEEPASNTTIKFGAGHDRPWFVARGSIEEQRAQIGKAFGVAVGAKTLAELAVEASLVAHGLINAADGIGAKPAGRVLPTGDTVAPGTTPEDVRRSIAAKAAEREQAQPEDHTDDIEALIAGATSRKALEDIRDAHKANWTDAHQLQARQRLAELEK